jgi:CheY-like chemotaxis protein
MAHRRLVTGNLQSTNTNRRGAGIGLASAYGIVKCHRGYIDIESEPGRETTVTIYLPVRGKKLEEDVKPSEQIMKKTETVLAVDDDDQVLRIAGRILAQLGYIVLCAQGGSEAVEIYKEKKDKIDLVLLDIIMPDMDGGKVYDSMKEINPDVKVLLMSGYSGDGKAKALLASGCDAFIEKPFEMQELSQKIREILNMK